LPIGGRIAEVRLLAIEPRWRGSAVMAGLANFLEPECRARKLEMLIVSATTRQRRLYRHLGFSEFGPLVGHEGAWFQPMRLTWPQFQQIVPSATWRRRDG
jgi:N-acetylglutamate synthase-like GNAT family acetyltransferase